MHSLFTSYPYSFALFKHSRSPTESSSTSHLPRSLNFMDYSPDYGKESSLFVPSLPFISSPCPYGTLPQPLRFSLIVHWRFSVLFLKDRNIFCFSLSLFTYIIARIFHLSSTFSKKIQKFFENKKSEFFTRLSVFCRFFF